jgi:hypothetical protein
MASAEYRPLHNLETLFPGRQIVNIFNENSVNFFFFGCWNEGFGIDCENKEIDNQNLAQTEEIIKNINENKDIKMGIVNGDNFYPKKTKTKIINDKNVEETIKTKNFDLTIIEKGFDVLKKFEGGDIYVGIGNHELDNESENKCATLIEEIHQTDNKIKIPSNYYFIDSVCTEGTVRIFILDTNLMSANECYMEHLQNKNSMDNEKQNMISWFRHNIHETCKKEDILNIIVVGHNPLFSVKAKKKKTKNVQNGNLEYFDYALNEGFSFRLELVMNEIREIIHECEYYNKGKTIYYLASHVHNYQYITNRNIHQYIIGTGGAHRDDVDQISTMFLTSSYDENGNKETYNIIHTQQKYGYLNFNSSNQIPFDFIDTTVEKGKVTEMCINTMETAQKTLTGGSSRNKLKKYEYKLNKLLQKFNKN